MSKSKSSSSTDQAQTTLSADGVVTGSVINIATKGNGNIAITDQFPDSVANVMKQLIDLSGQSIGAAMDAGQAALNTATQAAQQASQPDLEIVKMQSKYLPYIFLGAGLIAVVALWRRK